MKHTKLFTAISKCVAVGVIGIQLAHAGNSITVDSTSDQTEPGFTTLREAIEASNNISGAEINFDPQLFSSPQTISLENGELRISSSMTINGPGADLLTIDGQNLSRILTIDDGTSAAQDVSVSNITFTAGNGVSMNAVNLENNRGGCIFTKESLTLSDSVVTACNSSIDGGGVASLNAQFLIIDSVISDNSTTFKAGGIKSQGGQLTIINSTISGNRANRFTYAGGAIETSNTPLNIINSTISNNQAIAGAIGGISIYQSSDLTLLNTTVVNNTGGGISTRRASLVNISNSIVADNSDGECNFIQINANSNNQFNLDTDGSCDVLATNHIIVADPMLEPLADFGGLTQTHRPLPGSPVIDAGDDASCLEFDQRGEVRPQDGNADGSLVCDIGAVELSPNEQVPEEVIFRNGFDEFICEVEINSFNPNRGCR